MKTAVEWLINELFNESTVVVTKENNPALFEVIEKAKAMEKEQMNKMYDHAVLAILDGNGHGQNFDEYYNETYKNTDETL